MGKSKFKVGDKVRYKNGNNTKIYTISYVLYDGSDRRNKYKLFDFPDTTYFCAYELEKVEDPITNDSSNVKNQYDNNGENTRVLKLTLKDAQKMYDAGGTLREYALKVFTEDELNPKSKVPRTWDDYCDNFYPCEKHIHFTPQFTHGFCWQDAEAIVAFGRLIRLHRAWVGQWTPNWEKHTEDKWCIVFSQNTFNAACFWTMRHSLSFPTKEMAEDFINTFVDLLEKAKTLI